MATVRTGSTPPHPSISLVAPPLPVQNGPATGNKVVMSTREVKCASKTHEAAPFAAVIYIHTATAAALNTEEDNT